MQQNAVLSWETTKLTYKFSPSIHCVFLFVLIVCMVQQLWSHNFLIYSESLKGITTQPADVTSQTQFCSFPALR